MPAGPAGPSFNVEPVVELLRAQNPVVINLGLELFAETLARQGLKVIHVDWRPPAGGNPELADMLAALGRS